MLHQIGRAMRRGSFALVAALVGAQAAHGGLIGLIERNYTSNFEATDRHWFYKNIDGTAQDPAEGGGVYNSLEWAEGRSYNIPGAVYTMGSSLPITLKFTNPQWIGYNVTLTVHNVRLRIPPRNQNETTTYYTLLGGGPYTFSIGDMGQTATVNVTFSSLPGYVCRGYLEVEATARDGANQLLWTTDGHAAWETVYVVLGTPQLYMEKPWTDVLEYACVWAQGKDQEAAAAYDCTLGLFLSGLFEYNLDEEGVPWKFFDEHTAKFNLKDRLDYPQSSPGNCVDVSTFNSICMNALGIELGLKQQEQDAGFVTHPICPIGSDRSDTGNYRQVAFSMHQQVHLGNSVYDAALALLYDPWGSSYMNPPAGWDLGPPGYWQSPTGPSPPPAYGLVKRYWNAFYDSASIDPSLGAEPVSFTPDTFYYGGVQ